MKSERFLWVSVILVISLFVITVGISLPQHDMSEGGQMTGCPIMMDRNVICSMSAQEHLSAWQSMFAAIPPQSLLLAPLLLLVVIISRYLLYKPSRVLYFQSKERFTPIFDYLQEAFSSGLIHSKAF